jgi:hypothetical protein
VGQAFVPDSCVASEMRHNDAMPSGMDFQRSYTINEFRE